MRNKEVAFNVSPRLKAATPAELQLIMDVLLSAQEMDIISGRQVDDINREVIQGKNRGVAGDRSAAAAATLLPPCPHLLHASIDACSSFACHLACTEEQLLVAC